jgi:putative ABC transport system permease protein
VQGFTLFIGILVVGGFFQIQTLQKVPQIGMLKAIGTSNGIVATTTLLQIVAVTVVGVLIGSIGTLLLSLGLPAGIPILFSGPASLPGGCHHVIDRAVRRVGLNPDGITY